MYSQQELDDAVASGVISAEAADALRAHIERQRSTAIPDEEQFRLITGFNDIFVSIAAAILLFALGWIGSAAGSAFSHAIATAPPAINQPTEFWQVLAAGGLIAAAAWSLALFFTARRRMALPSILLLLAFVGGVLAASGAAVGLVVGGQNLDGNNQLSGVVAAVAAAIAAGGAWLHWRRFHVPITIAALAASLAGVLLALLVAALGKAVHDPEKIILSFVLLLGVGMFLFAMWWDSSDRARLTRRSDVAFWLHLLAAPMIVHPIFTLLGLTSGNQINVSEALAAIGLYLVLGLTALAVDRRALLVSALAYVLFAMQQLFRQFGAVELNVALTALVIGSALLLLSAFWHQTRAAIVRPLPERLRERLPVLDRAAAVATQQAA
jgi:hypothetical protein